LICTDKEYKRLLESVRQQVKDKKVDIGDPVAFKNHVCSIIHSEEGLEEYLKKSRLRQDPVAAFQKEILKRRRKER